jgi:hypothetical protein
LGVYIVALRPLKQDNKSGIYLVISTKCFPFVSCAATTVTTQQQKCGITTCMKYSASQYSTAGSGTANTILIRKEIRTSGKNVWRLLYFKCVNICGRIVRSAGEGRAIAQAVSRWLPTAAARIRSQVKSCGICGGQSGIGAGFPCQSSFHQLLHNHHHRSSGAGTKGK